MPSNQKEGTMSTAFPHCWMECKARAGWLNVPSVPGALGRTLCHYGQSAPADLGLGCPQGARAKAPRRSDWQETDLETPILPRQAVQRFLALLAPSHGQNPCVLRRGFSHLSFRDISRREAMTRLSPPIPSLRPP